MTKFFIASTLVLFGLSAQAKSGPLTCVVNQEGISQIRLYTEPTSGKDTIEIMSDDGKTETHIVDFADMRERSGLALPSMGSMRLALREERVDQSVFDYYFVTSGDGYARSETRLDCDGGI